MSSIQEPNSTSAAVPARRTPTEPTVAPAKVEPSAPAAAQDSLQANNRPDAPTAPGDLVAKIKAMQEPTPPAAPPPTEIRSVPVSQRVRRRIVPEGMPDRPSDFVAPILNLAISFLSNPRFAVRRIQGAITRSFQVMQGAGHVREVVQDFNLARQQGKGLHFVRGQFRFLKWRSTAKARQAIRLAKAHKGRNLLRLLSRRNAADIARNKGVIGFFRDARAAGAGPLRSLWRGFTRTVETGGQMPSVAKQAAEMGGRWGKALTWTGRIGRIAPLLNVPLAIFDVREAWKALRHPDATVQDKVSKTGQAALTSAAAGLAVAGFVTPPPLNAALLTAAGVAGIGSTLWGIATSEIAHDALKKVGGFFGGLGRRLGLG